MKRAFALLLLVFANTALAADICSATTRGIVCHPICTGGTVWNAGYNACVPSSCSGGMVTKPLPLGGPGVMCSPPDCGATASWVWDSVALAQGHCQPNGIQAGNSVQPPPAETATTCTLTMQWTLLDPHDARIVQITPTCDLSADLATYQLLGRLILSR